MLFNSFDFAIFVLVVFGLYYSLFKNHQVSFIVAASLVFYAWGQPCWLILLMLSIALNSYASWKIFKSEDRKFKLACSTICIALNLILLACFKYAALGVTVASKFTTLPPSVQALASIVLPIGISFYTFEGISLIVDSIRKQTSEASDESALNHVRNTALFFSFFPHLAAGPIVRPHQFYPQIGAKQFKDINWKSAVDNLIVGYFFKNVIADNLAVHTTPVLTDSISFAGKDILAGWFGYAARFFADFAGYSLIAIGLAALFGYSLPTNFNFPYRSQSLSEFWTRWHITLSTWIRDYLYIPLGGNRKGRIRTYLNLLIAMLLGGLWHGGKVGFAVWGLYHGIGLCIERAVGLSHKKSKAKIVVFVRVVSVFLFVTLGLLLFETPLHMVPEFFKSIAANWKFPADSQHSFLICLFVLPVVVWHLVDLWIEKHPDNTSLRSRMKELVLATMLFLVITDSGVAQEFFYFQF